MDLGQMNIVLTRIGSCTKYKNITFPKHCITVWYSAFFTRMIQKDKQCSRRQIQILYRQPDPWMSFAHRNVNKMHIRFFTVIRKGRQNIPALIDHMQLFRAERQQTSLEQYGYKYHAKYNMEQIMGKHCAASCCHNGKYNGRCATQPRPCSQKLLLWFCPERCQDQSHG